MSDEADRAAILARRRRFVAVALAGLGSCTPDPPAQTPSEPTAVPPAPATSAPLTQALAAADTDGDGVLDMDDRCPTIVGVRGKPDELGCPPRPCLNISSGEILILDKVQFDKFSPTLLVPAAQVLDAVAATLATHPELDVDVAGHCEKPERPAIAKRRGEVVREALVKRGVAKTRLGVADVAECETTDPKDTAASEAARRVDFPNVRQRDENPGERR